MRNVLVVAALAGGAALMSKYLKKSEGASKWSTVEETAEVDVPVRTAYNQWTQFEEFPQFMNGVLEVRQLDNRRLHWRVRIAGKEEQWDSEITEQIPDQRIAWRSLSGARNEGVVHFEPISDSRCRIRLQMSYAPSGLVEGVGDALGVPSARAHGNLKRFKEFIEGRGRETGAWRGTVESTGSGASSGGSGVGTSPGAGFH